MSAAFGLPRRHLRVTGSTNEQARALAEAGAPTGTVVTAAEQTAGRGRRGRRWSAPPGDALLATAILRPLTKRHRLLPLSVPLAVCEAIEAVAPVSCRVKWPNDVWIEERKVAGVLIEALPPEWALIGVGINVSVPDDAFAPGLRWPATSVGNGVGVEAMLAALCDGLAAWVDAGSESILAGFRERDALRGRAVEWDGGAGVAAGVDDDGNLVVDSDDGGQARLGAGEVQLRVSAARRGSRAAPPRRRPAR
jgi:BirA family biotin operon repressor/biotin-[acetyl-CoA-carboxylase] ligase